MAGSGAPLRRWTLGAAIVASLLLVVARACDGEEVVDATHGPAGPEPEREGAPPTVEPRRRTDVTEEAPAPPAGTAPTKAALGLIELSRDQSVVPASFGGTVLHSDGSLVGGIRITLMRGDEELAREPIRENGRFAFYATAADDLARNGSLFVWPNHVAAATFSRGDASFPLPDDWPERHDLTLRLPTSPDAQARRAVEGPLSDPTKPGEDLAGKRLVRVRLRYPDGKTPPAVDVSWASADAGLPQFVSHGWHTENVTAPHDGYKRVGLVTAPEGGELVFPLPSSDRPFDVRFDAMVADDVFGPFVAPQTGDLVLALSFRSFSIGVIRLVDADGRPVGGRDFARTRAGTAFGPRLPLSLGSTRGGYIPVPLGFGPQDVFVVREALTPDGRAYRVYTAVARNVLADDGARVPEVVVPREALDGPVPQMPTPLAR